MPKAVRFTEYGGIDVLNVVDVERTVPGERQVLVKVVAAGINPGEAAIRRGFLHDRFPATFPSGQGSDLAGIVEELGAGATGFAVGDEVIGFTHKQASHAEYVIVDDDHLTPRPAAVPWERAGALFVAGTTGYAAVHASGSSVARPSSSPGPQVEWALSSSNSPGAPEPPSSAWPVSPTTHGLPGTERSH
ncbi:alcohol dehydrogenase catalytic domain-containing protein [Streptomyces europaeiscabiei]|uniref:alcohol dehydrogenase catalytic domain-containing protein n=1 Tax=Streptomyces TaxID=1883 RepID=UPI00211B29BB|nr:MULTISPECIES: alcohol dehydrogenase catalytic domain-containing protein [Streptomyces]MDX3637648.1 alcohol dehydrogenase catalytic domain-containing protein [Streptomyces europaeiscabiei]MDX3654881.1 alcohol dehydrogenase catalytic domain-containing protein [Streptomyces europaeiscabiei]WUD30233.1 alcohol dehydrogenase catalytic domain-containing protein [Streptomyces europaeiscabiei]